MCAREVQNSLEESVYQTIIDSIERLRYPGWKVTKDSISCLKTGSRFIFRGLKDLRSASAVKSMANIDRLWLEEAQCISSESIKIVIPTIRKAGSEIWASWNPFSLADPIEELKLKSGAWSVFLNWYDNPWFPPVLKQEMEDDFKRNPDEAEHIWNGQPRIQAENSIMSRVVVRMAMERVLEAIGGEQIGVDVARYGDDSTQMYRRKGLAVTKQKSMRKSGTIEVGRAVWEFADRRDDIPMLVDEGYNPGVIDWLKEQGANVQGVSFGSSASNPDKYPNAVSEMWFEFPISEAALPNDQELMVQLADRRYRYDKQNRRIVEPKDDYKKRNGGKSPDKADALLLTFYQPQAAAFAPEIQKQMSSRRARERSAA
jgi:phage terminase large subunit